MNISKVLFPSLFFLFSVSVSGQNDTSCDCKTDLSFIIEKIKKTPSYKKQVRKHKSHSFFRVKNEISKKMKHPIPTFDCYRLISSLLATIDDKHMALRGITPKLSITDIKDSVWGNSYRKTDVFKKHPRYQGDLMALESSLRTKPSNNIEGIYRMGKSLTLGVVKVAPEKLIGVVISTNFYNWEAGQILLYLYPKGNDQFDTIFYSIKDKGLRFIPKMVCSNGNILKGFQKQEIPNQSFVEHKGRNWIFKQINDSIQYLYFRKFSNTKTIARESKAFYNEIKPKLTAKNLIIDLRGNGGGNSKNSDAFLKLFKRKNLYVLTNYFTASNAEQFTLKIRKIKGAKHLGQRTNGTLAYGRNYGYSYTTPSGNFDILPTDMNFHKYIEYEIVGIQPDIELDNSEDWVTQTIKLIQQVKTE